MNTLCGVRHPGPRVLVVNLPLLYRQMLFSIPPTTLLARSNVQRDDTIAGSLDSSMRQSIIAIRAIGQMVPSAEGLPTIAIEHAQPRVHDEMFALRHRASILGTVK